MRRQIKKIEVNYNTPVLQKSFPSKVFTGRASTRSTSSSFPFFSVSNDFFLNLLSYSDSKASSFTSATRVTCLLKDNEINQLCKKHLYLRGTPFSSIKKMIWQQKVDRCIYKYMYTYLNNFYIIKEHRMVWVFCSYVAWKV